MIRKIVIKLTEKSVVINKIVRALLPLYQLMQHKKQNKLFLNRGGELLANFKTCLDQHGLKFWLTCGTLLGAYREHQLLGHDSDLDVAMFAEDREQAMAALISYGFKLEHEFGVVGEGIKEQSYCFKDVKIDIFYVEKRDNSLVAHVFFKKEISSKSDDFNVIEIFFPETDFVEYEFLGNNYLIPEKTVEYLSANYGENFMTPDKSWDYRKDIPSAKYYTLEEKRGFIHR